jgi:tetratricopeptide (TPR) repeat protein
MAQNNLAAFLEVHGRQLDEAERLYRRILGFWEGLAAGDPSNPGYRSRLALTLDNLSGALAKTGRNLEAEKALRRVVELRAALTRDFPSSPHHFFKLGGALRGLAKLVTLRGDLGEARRLQEQLIASSRALLALAPQNADLLRDAPVLRSELIETLIGLGEHEGAARSVAELVALSPGSGPVCARAGSFLARCVPLAEADTHLAGSRRADLAKTYADRAVELLREAVKSGAANVEALRADLET